MNHARSVTEIQQLCGMTSYRRGEEYYNSNRVKRVTYDSKEHEYEALVMGSRSYHVTITFHEESSKIDAVCECDAYISDVTYCKHIAAVLLYIRDVPQPDTLHQQQPITAFDESDRSIESAETVRDLRVTNSVISLFDQTILDKQEDRIIGHKETLDVEFICRAIHYSSSAHYFTIELKIGLKRLYVVQKPKHFLTSVERQVPFTFTKLFTYDPTVHVFSETDQAIIDQLIEIKRTEAAYHDAFSTYSSNHTLGSDRSLYIPPMAWETLLPKLLQANVRFENGLITYNRLEVSDHGLPLAFDLGSEFPRAEETYQLDIHGLDDLKVMKEYGCVVAEGTIYTINKTQLDQLADLQDTLYRYPKRQLTISNEQIEPFMERVVPQLRRLGAVMIAQHISERIATPPLQAKLYLDRDFERLIARLEYQYADTRIDPFGYQGEPPERDSRILIRDIENERKIMSRFEYSAFKIHGNELYMDDEDEIFDFLYYELPELKKIMEVYVTPSIQTIVHEDLYQPKIAMDLESKTNWLEIRFDVEGIDDQEIRNILRTVVEKKKYYRLPDGTYISLESTGFHQVAELIQQMGIRKSQIGSNRIELPVARGFHLLDSTESNPSVRIGKSLRQLFQNMKHPDNLEFQVPEQLTSVLRDYQKYGFQWLKTLAYYQFGGILADDMGLGKTLQSIALILSERDQIQQSQAPVLIVCPASLTYNWKNELKKFAPELRATVVNGTKQERQSMISDFSETDVLITSYPLLRRDLEWYTGHQFHMLILDEAQAIKNHATQTAQAVKEMKAKHRFALTGTPVENSLDELWSIFDAIFPDLFFTKKEFTDLTQEQVAKRVRPFILRRLKSDVLKELPDKIETLQTSELTDDQKKLYVAYLAKLQEETLRDLSTEGFHKNRMKILAGLTRLRQLCCHPSLFVDRYEGTSGKLEQLLEIVEECLSSGKRLLIFSQFTEMLSIIRQELSNRQLSYFYLDGKTPASERVELCQRFNDGEHDIFLISLKAGGTGLNLTGADTVILYDLWWNPAVEQQAADRAHRIGQKNVVQVIRLITEGTIEEKMYELQQKKRDLIDAVIQPGEQALSAFTEKEIREILMLGA